MADAAALLATMLAVTAALPQLRRVIVDGDGRGVSLTSSMLGIGTELAWVGYTASEGLWTAFPEAVLMVCSNSILAIALVRWGAAGRAAGAVGATWIVALAAVAALGGPGALAVALAGAYALQVAPVVWTVWRTPQPTGVAAATWAMVGVEGVLWGAYGLHHSDPALTWFAAIAVVASAATLVRKAMVATPGPSSVVIRPVAVTSPSAPPAEAGAVPVGIGGFGGHPSPQAVGFTD